MQGLRQSTKKENRIYFMMIKILDVCSGIGGFSLGLEATGGFDTVAFCEFDDFCCKILNKHWPSYLGR